MKCLMCGFPNPGTVSYCQKCGQKLDLTADEIQDSLAETAKKETQKSTEFYARRVLVFAVVFFVFAVTAFVATGGTPAETYYIPSASNGTEYTEVDYRFDVEPEMMDIKLENK
ncbi:MAG: hypothetical protein ACYTAF_14195 [Planctomycetota bacterium]|jgi:uncharacterized membrane protein YvbJ